MNNIKNLHIVKHPLLRHKLSILRKKNTSNKEFRELLNEITLLLAYEATKTLPLSNENIETPLETFTSPILEDNKPVILPILRAGIGMVDSFLSLMPTAAVGHIGLYRDETSLEPHRYYFKIPKNSKNKQYFVCDPMLATGGTAVDTITQLKAEGITRIIFVCIVAAPEGVETLTTAHPDITIYSASLDRELNSNGYILPGLGDAGDRLFGTQ